MWITEDFFFQFGEQLKALLKLVPDPDMQCFIIDGNRLDADDVIGILKGYAGFEDEQPPAA
jgi:hypothetical protein